MTLCGSGLLHLPAIILLSVWQVCKREIKGRSNRRALQATVCAALCYRSWYAPVDTIPRNLVAPMLGRASFPWTYKGTEFEPGPEAAAVSMLGWIFLCDRFGAGVAAALDGLLTL